MSSNGLIGMQLGEQSADFSRSLLRQRIDKTSKLLGIDFPSHGVRPSTADESIHRLHTGSVDESISGEDHGSLSKKSFASFTGLLSSVDSRGKTLEDALKVFYIVHAGRFHDCNFIFSILGNQIAGICGRLSYSKQEVVGYPEEAKGVEDGDSAQELRRKNWQEDKVCHVGISGRFWIRGP